MKQVKFPAILMAILAYACDDSIQPAATFEPKLVAYSVLSTKSDTQWVRLYQSYDSPGNDASLNPDEQAVQNANVTITGGAQTYTFSYGSIPRPDTSRYKSNIGVYFAYPFRPASNTNYSLTIASSIGNASASIKIPGQGGISCGTTAELSNPFTSRSIRAYFTLNNLARAWLIQFYVVYSSENPGELGVEKYHEVPLIDEVLNINFGIHRRVFPTVKTSPASIKPAQFITQSFDFEYPSYNESIYQIHHDNFNVHFKRAVFYLIQFDEPWYKYFASSNLRQDKLSHRVEPPHYTNILGGVGLFGSFHVDSVVVALPEFMFPYR